MTETPGGSDVRTGTTQEGPKRPDAHTSPHVPPVVHLDTRSTSFWHSPANGRTVLLHVVGGCSPMAPATRMFLQRFKDKLDNHANASGEFEYDGATA
ncbi:hypothetical protein [Mycobacterium lepromatosis]|uniref:hypothetical protein n=1 Tax=Mycobacterium lepromatosis TaxID=480418 RepID=UPI000A547F68